MPKELLEGLEIVTRIIMLPCQTPAEALVLRSNICSRGDRENSKVLVNAIGGNEDPKLPQIAYYSILNKTITVDDEPPAKQRKTSDVVHSVIEAKVKQCLVTSLAYTGKLLQCLCSVHNS